jgi:N-acetyl-anhydromuramyl-L-alanine amidase AmpD
MNDGWFPGAMELENKVARWVGNTGFGALVMHIAGDHSRHNGDAYLAGTKDKSAHFFVNRDGSAKQYVSVFDSAWANGITPVAGGRWVSPEGHIVTPRWHWLRPGQNPNHYTVSMEHQGDPGDAWTSAEFDTTVNIMRWLAPRKGVAWWIVGQNLIGHSDLSPVDRPNCPGLHCDFKALALAANARRMVATVDATIYEVPAVNPTRVALHGGAVLRAGYECIIDMGYSNGMVHLADGLGFVEGSKLRLV